MTAPATISPRSSSSKLSSSSISLPSTKSVLELGFGSLCRWSKLKGLGFQFDLAKFDFDLAILEKTNANGASLVLGWQKRHMKKNGQWINQKAEEDFGKILAELETQRQAADDPSSVDEAMVLRNALGEGRCHNRGVGRKLKCVSRYPQPSQPTNQGTSSTMQQVMWRMYYNMQQMQQALCAQIPNYQPAVQFSDPTLSAQNLNFQQMMMQFNEHAQGLHELRDEETTSDDE